MFDQMAPTVTALIITFVNSVLQLVVAFGVQITDEQNAAITAVTNALLALAVAVFHLWRAQPAPKPSPTPPPTG